MTRVALAGRSGVWPRHGGLAVRAALAAGLLLVLALLFRDRIAALDLAGIARRFSGIGPSQWGLALCATAVSFWAVGRYDRVVHAALGTGVAPAAAGGSGIMAIAIGQTVGLGVLAGAVVRWRMLPQLGLWQATRISAAVAASFLAGLAVVAAVLVLATGLAGTQGLRPLAWAVLAVAALLPLLTLWPPGPLARVPLPPLRAMAAVVGLVALDCGAAALALAALMPAATLPALPPFVTAVLLALGLGIVSGTPGGIGPFEVTLLVLLPQVPAEPLLAAVLGFRLVYHVVPAVVAGAGALVVELRGLRPAPPARRGAAPVSSAPQTDRHLAAAARAEAGLMRDTGLALWSAGVPVLPLARAGNHLVALGDPLAPLPDLPLRIVAAARDRALWPLLYKCGPRTAARARRAGWTVQQVAAEAVLDPRRFDASSPVLRQLRRKLRKAEAAGIVARMAQGALPLARLAAISAEWSAAHGAERGFSMGRFPGSSLTTGRVVLAWRGDEIVAFATFHAAAGEWVLDLMRHSRDVPDGTMPALVRAAIAAAAAEGVPRLSLAAVPKLACHLPPALAHRFDHAAGTDGLTRFKAQFAPCWEPRYAAAPNRAALALGLLAVGRAVTRPA